MARYLQNIAQRDALGVCMLHKMGYYLWMQKRILTVELLSRGYMCMLLHFALRDTIGISSP